MDYFFYCRDRPESAALRSELIEAHWTFMDRYAETMIARGPTLTPDGEQSTGSLHIVGLPDSAAAREFAFDEPNYQAGVYREVLVRRWRNVLGRTMWQFTGAVAGYQRFLILAHAKPETAASRESLDEAHHDYLERGYRDRLIAYGPLFSEDGAEEDGAEWAGTALMVELPDRTAADALMADEPYARNGLYVTVEIHHWEFGGRR
ncbi:hypothetical protein ETD83_04815 [Actinomadura soli]|uniref:YCII-related domain-containing protein n=1 Tax=Actinomadura soli TaxID=2508997 RepID=A0A5C4JJ91_9ACTN|nr:YciI family protein [Actinomadura soli]TMR06418.1 hypothetical protein ETD83_04815 [Actinomadura soli]